MYSMHHRNSAAWGREAEEKRERREKKKKPTTKEKNKTKKGKMKKKSMKERREEKKNEKRKRLRGHSKHSLTTLQFWRLRPGPPGSRRVERPGESWVSSELTLGRGHPGRGTGRPCTACCLHSAPSSWAQHRGLSWDTWEKRRRSSHFFSLTGRRRVQ